MDENNNKVYQCTKCKYPPTLSLANFRKHTKTKTHKLNFTKPGEKVKYDHNCDDCDYHTDIISKFKEHELTKGHMEKMKVKPKFRHYCIDCKYGTNRNDEFKDHLDSDKHNKKAETPLVEKTFKCPKIDCEYVARTEQHLENHIKGKMHNMSEDEKKKLRIKNGKKNSLTGYKAEKFINDLIKSLDIVKSSRIIGYTGSIFDIKYQLKEEKCYRYLQVKTISEVPLREGHSIKISTDYKEKTLTIGVNSEFTLFFQMFSDEIKTSTIGYYPKSESKDGSDYKDYFYHDKEEFIKDLIENLKLSVSLEKETMGLNSGQKSEFFSLKRLKKKCKGQNIKYNPKIDNIKEIDCFANDFKIQHKSANSNHFGIVRKSSKTERPYSDKDDIDCFIFENTSKENKNEFFIIPIDVMIEEKFITTDYQDGKSTITLPFIRNGEWSDENHWALEYYENFNYFTENIVLHYDEKLDLYV